MTNPPSLAATEAALIAGLAEAFPGWQIWIVHRAKEHGGDQWCAGRPLGEVHGGSAKELADHIRMKLEDEAEEAR